MEMKNKTEATDNIRRSMFLYGKALRLMSQAIERFEIGTKLGEWDDMLAYDMKDSMSSCGGNLGKLTEYYYECQAEIDGKVDKNGNYKKSEDDIDAL